MDIFVKISRDLKRVKRGHHLHVTIDRYVGLPLRVTKTHAPFQVRKKRSQSQNPTRAPS